MAAASVIFSSVWISSILIGTPLPVHAAATSGSIEEQIIESLKPATEYQPQIMLPKDANLNQITSKQQKQGPILEGRSHHRIQSSIFVEMYWISNSK